MARHATKPAPTQQRRRGPWPVLALDEIRLDGDTQPRDEIDHDVVAEYADLYRAGVKLPPIVVFFDAPNFWLADGFHRRWAAVEAGLDRLPCDIRDGSLQDARWFACSANQTHGLRRSNADKRKAVLAALRHPKGKKMSDSAIAEHVGVSQPFVGKLRAESAATYNDYKSETRTGRDGRTIKVVAIDKAGKANDEPREVCVTVLPVDNEPREVHVKVAPVDELTVVRTAGPLTVTPAGGTLTVTRADGPLRIIGRPEPSAPPRCPNCGSHRVDDDGDCLDCKEPDVAPPAAPVGAADDTVESTISVGTLNKLASFNACVDRLRCDFGQIDLPNESAPGRLLRAFVNVSEELGKWTCDEIDRCTAAGQWPEDDA